MKKSELYIKDRENGLTCREIAEKYGVSKQYVSQCCSKYNPTYFRVWGASSCIYPNVRKWLNKNMVSAGELLRRLSLCQHEANHERLRSYLKGKSYPRKLVIDKLLSITGLTYEQFFEVGELDEV